MATTQLSLTATPGRRYSFAAKSAALSTPATRLHKVLSESRTWSVAPENRTFKVLSEDRTFEVI